MCISHAWAMTPIIAYHSDMRYYSKQCSSCINQAWAIVQTILYVYQSGMGYKSKQYTMCINEASAMTPNNTQCMFNVAINSP